jgi:hypothetical protein
MSNVRSVIPQDLDFFSDIERLGGVLNSVDTYENAQQNNISNGQIVHFFYTQSDALDLRESFLRFQLQGNLNGSGTVGAFQNGISCVINRLRLLWGAETLIDLVNFNVVYMNYLMSKTVQTFSNTFNIMMATSDNLATRQANFTNINKVYTVYLGWIATFLNKIIPIGAANQQLHLELTLETPSYCITSDSVNPTFQMLTPQFHYKKITYTEVYRNMLMNKLKTSGSISILFLNYSNYVQPVPAGTTFIQITAPWKYSRAIGYNVIARNSANISSLTQDNKFTIYDNANIIVNYRSKVNNDYYPQDAVNGNTESYDSYLEYHDLPYQIDTYAGTNWTSADPSFYERCLNINQHPKHLNMDDFKIQGIDTSLGSSTWVDESKYSAPGTAANQQWDFFVQFFSCVSIDMYGNIKIDN